jgi:hypothetical protein
VFENVVLKKMFGPEKEKGTRGCIMHNEEVYDFYCSAVSIKISP